LRETCELLTDLLRLGLRVELVNGQPRLRGAKAAITPELLEGLKHHRANIIVWLTRREWKLSCGHVFAETYWDDWWGTGARPETAEWERRLGDPLWKRIGDGNVVVSTHHPKVQRPAPVQRTLGLDC
jgi:hypothetical protein